jgi:hypothetical protein
MKDYSVWGFESEFTLTEGLCPLPHDTPELKFVKVIHAETWDDAVQQYNYFLGNLPVDQPPQGS